jgi:hypothetical protein
MRLRKKKAESLDHHAVSIGTFAAFFYTVCLLYGLTLTDPFLKQFHLASLQLALPGFTGYTMLSIIWGAALSFVYGFMISTLYHTLHRDCNCSLGR